MDYDVMCERCFKEEVPPLGLWAMGIIYNDHACEKCGKVCQCVSAHSCRKTASKGV